MPVGEMEKNVQEYLEVQVFEIKFCKTIDEYIFGEYW